MELAGAMNETKKVLLSRPHTHRSTRFKVGDVVELPARIADWLISQGGGEEATAAARTTPQAARIVRPCCGRKA